MSKQIISYALFGSRVTPSWLFNFYLRGFVWNVKMNRLIYPDWKTHVEIDVDTFSDYDHIFRGLEEHYGISFGVNPVEPLCKSMLWRLKPVFMPGVDVVLCRDADAITTSREATAVHQWRQSQYSILGLNDNKSHSLPLMGGMIGVETSLIKAEFASWDELISQASTNLTVHGSDQDFLMATLYRRFKDHIWQVDMTQVGHNYNDPLWTSDLTCRHIGSAGVVEMETIRFFNQHDADSKLIEIEKKYSHVFYWHL